MAWREKEYCLCSGSSLLFLGAPSTSPPTSPGRQRKLPPGCRAQDAVLMLARPLFARHPRDERAPPLLYFEVFVKTPGGGAQPSGTVGVGVAEKLTGEGAEDDGRARRFLHYQSSKGTKQDGFPRNASRPPRPCGPSFSSGDTIGCGWTHSGAVFFTFNGRHLGNAWSDVWGEFHPAVTVDTPGACVEFSMGDDGQRALRYAGDGRSPDLSERLFARLVPARQSERHADLPAVSGDSVRAVAAAAAAAVTGRLAAAEARLVAAEDSMSRRLAAAEENVTRRLAVAEECGARAVAAATAAVGHGRLHATPTPGSRKNSATPSEERMAAASPVRSCPLAEMQDSPASEPRSAAPPWLVGMLGNPSWAYSFRSAQTSNQEPPMARAATLPASCGASELPVAASQPLDVDTAESSLGLLDELLNQSAASFGASLAGRLGPANACQSSTSLLSAFSTPAAADLSSVTSRGRDGSGTAELSDPSDASEREAHHATPPMIAHSSRASRASTADSFPRWPGSTPSMHLDSAPMPSSMTRTVHSSPQLHSAGWGSLPLPAMALNSPVSEQLDQLQMVNEVGRQCAQLQRALRDAIDHWLQRVPTTLSSEAVILESRHACAVHEEAGMPIGLNGCASRDARATNGSGSEASSDSLLAARAAAPAAVWDRPVHDAALVGAPSSAPSRIDKLLQLYERAREVTAREARRRELLRLHRRHAGAPIGSEDAQAIVQDIVLELSWEQRDSRLGASALVSRISRTAEGARHVIKAGGAALLVSVWLAKHSSHAPSADLQIDLDKEKERSHRPAAAAAARAGAAAAAAPGAADASFALLAARYAAQSLAHLVICASSAQQRLGLLQEGCLQPILEIVAPPPSMHRAHPPTGEATHSSRPSSPVSVGVPGSSGRPLIGALDDLVWLEECRLVAAYALVEFCAHQQCHPELMRAGAVFRLLELTAAEEMKVALCGVQALRRLSENESLRLPLLREPGLLQGLVNLTCSEEAEVQKNALLAVTQLATQTNRSHYDVFLQLLPAIPLHEIVASDTAELPHACARLIYLLSRPNELSQPSLAQSNGSVQTRLKKLLDATARPLIALLRSDWLAVRSSAVQAVGRLTQASEYAQRVLIDIDVLTPLIAILGGEDSQARQHAAFALNDLSHCTERQDVLARAAVVRALVLATHDYAHNQPAVAAAVLLTLDRICSHSILGLPNLQAVGPKLLRAFLVVARRDLPRIKSALAPASKILHLLSMSIALRCAKPEGVPPADAVNSPLSARAAHEMLDSLVPAASALLSECANRTIAASASQPATPPHAASQPSMQLVEQRPPPPRPSPDSTKIAISALQVTANALAPTLPPVAAAITNALATHAADTVQESPRPHEPPAIAIPPPVTPDCSRGASLLSTAPEAEAIENACLLLCEVLGAIWRCAESGVEGLELRLRIVNGSAKSIYTLAHNPDLLVREAAVCELAGTLLERFGFPVDNHKQLSEIAATDRFGFGLACWWFHDATIRAALSETASPSACNSSPGAGDSPPSAIVSSPAAAPSSAAAPATSDGARSIVLPLMTPPQPPRAIIFRSMHFVSFPVDAMLRQLTQDHPFLCALRFDGCSFDDEFCKQLIAAVARLPQLRVLCFRGGPDLPEDRLSQFTPVAFVMTRNSRSPAIGLSPPGAARDEPLAFLPLELPSNIEAFHLEEGAISKTGARVLAAALISATSLRLLSLAGNGLRAADLTPFFEGGSGLLACTLQSLSLANNKLGDAGVKLLSTSLVAGARAGNCVLRELDLSANQLTVVCIEDVCSIIGTVTSLEALDLRWNQLGASKAVVNALVGNVPAIEALQALPAVLNNLPAAIRAGSKAKDLLIAVLTNSTLWDLRIDSNVLGAREAMQLVQKLGRNHEHVQRLREHYELGADAPPNVPEAPGRGLSRRIKQRVASWNRGAARPGSEPPVLGVLFSAPLAILDQWGRVAPMETLDFAKERQLICDSMSEAKRALRVKFAHATTDRLRTLVTLGHCAGLHYSGHGDPTHLCMEDGRGAAHIVPIEQLRKLLRAGGVASLQFVFVSACYSEAAAQAFIDAGVLHVIAVRVNTRVSDVAAHTFTRAFYLSLAVGNTVQAAYDIGVQAVVSAPGVPGGGAFEADKFLLLPPGDNHAVAPFKSLAAVDQWEPPQPPTTRQQQPLPALVEGFIGRNVDVYKVVSAILDRRLVSVTGEPGVGKSAVAIAALNYLAERYYFSDGVLYIDVSSVRSVGELGRVLRSYTSLYSTASSTLLPELDLLATELQVAAIPLVALHCLLVLDGVQKELVGADGFLDLLMTLLKSGRVRTLLTMIEPVAQPLQGGAEKVIQISPLSADFAARLLCRLAPRPLRLSEIPGATSTSDFVQRLSAHGIISNLRGNPGLIKAAAPRLQGRSLEDVEAQLRSGEITLNKEKQSNRLGIPGISHSSASFKTDSSAKPPTANQHARTFGGQTPNRETSNSTSNMGSSSGGQRLRLPVVRRAVSS